MWRGHRVWPLQSCPPGYFSATAGNVACTASLAPVWYRMRSKLGACWGPMQKAARPATPSTRTFSLLSAGQGHMQSAQTFYCPERHCWCEVSAGWGPTAFCCRFLAACAAMPCRPAHLGISMPWLAPGRARRVTWRQLGRFQLDAAPATARTLLNSVLQALPSLHLPFLACRCLTVDRQQSVMLCLCATLQLCALGTFAATAGAAFCTVRHCHILPPACFWQASGQRVQAKPSHCFT